jgi:hypothetical protein
VRELEFLPDWYVVVRRRRKALVAQAWATAALLLILLVWTGVARFRVLTARNELAGVRRDMTATQADLNKLDSMILLQRRWTEQGEVLAKLGVSIESTRLMGLIAKATPNTVALIGLSLQNEEKVDQVKTVAAAKKLKDKDPDVSRKLRVRVQGVAPSDAEVADFMAKLAAISFLEDVSMGYAKDADEGGRAVREFEVTFALDLDAPAEAH